MNKYQEIFKLILDTTVLNSNRSENHILQKLEPFNNITFENLSDNDLYTILAYIPFYAGMNARTVGMKVGTIKSYFSNYKKVVQFNDSTIQRILSDPDMIKNKKKVNAAINNAKKVQELCLDYGSFKNYLRSLDFNKSPESLEEAAEILINAFSHLGPVTVHHFLTDIGAKTIKPDRAIMRVLKRLNLVKDVQFTDDARKICNRIAKATTNSHRYVDLVIVQFAQQSDALDLGVGHGICLEKNPKCNNCLLATKYCLFNKKSR